ncbi:MAG: phospholipase D-like domain-containing protein [Bacteroidales bacterium]|nr:phospholipase D-like domain-containing protein [Bacteroidales bacterium]
MQPAELDALLRQTLTDHKLSGSEKSSLIDWAHAHIDSDQDRGVARSRVFEIARQAATDEEARRVLSWVEAALKAILPLGANVGMTDPAHAPAEACFSPGDACLGQIAHRFAAVRRFADVCVFTITDNRIARVILEAHRRGVKIRIISDNEKALDPGSDIEQLADAGIPVRVDRSPYHMHHKFALFDDTRLLTGSYNWTRGAADQNAENLVDLGDPRLITAFRREFEALWERLT